MANCFICKFYEKCDCMPERHKDKCAFGGGHGKAINTRFEPYHDVTVYEDGYEEWFYIGD